MVYLTQVLLAVATLSSAALAAGIYPLERRAGCNADNCLRQQLRGGPSSIAASAYYSSLLSIPAVTATAATPFAITVTSTITSSLTLDVHLPTYPGYVAKRGAGPRSGVAGLKKQMVATTPTPTTTRPPQQSLPAFASMCTSSGTTSSRLNPPAAASPSPPAPQPSSPPQPPQSGPLSPPSSAPRTDLSRR
ncbi:hypothetical protein GJ744_006412 [Endocarpon pusillum]|uniref:Uncharacterized protein n=1 Tax=Endocarpon pusillum TaxID=364733 RepID=A0A8H7E8A0_9EURO|nr:hypothetical protein GJ744_006412 [Endocarpon pusillum]